MVTHRAAFQGLPLGQDLIFFDDFFVRPDLENGGALVELSDPAINALSSRAPGGREIAFSRPRGDHRGVDSAKGEGLNRNTSPV